MPTYESAGTYHERQRCTRAHATGDRVRTVEDTTGLEPCPVCVGTPEESGMNDGDVAQLIEAGRCPWCLQEDADDPYEGEYVGRHAASAHPDAWAAYQERQP